MHYQITAILNCSFFCRHASSVTPQGNESNIELSLSSLNDEPRKGWSPSILISFYETAPDNVVVEESGNRVHIHMPIAGFAGLYKVLSDALFDKRYIVKLITTGQQGLTSARFDFALKVS